MQLHIGGLDDWRDFDAYPPGAPDTQIWHLHPDNVLSQRPVKASEPDRYRYDPNKPTPSVGGAMFAFTGAGPVDQAPLEAPERCSGLHLRAAVRRRHHHRQCPRHDLRPRQPARMPICS